MDISLLELEQAINYWRVQRPAVGEECALSPEVNALAQVYAWFIIQHGTHVALASLGHMEQQLITSWKNSVAASILTEQA